MTELFLHSEKTGFWFPAAILGLVDRHIHPNFLSYLEKHYG